MVKGKIDLSYGQIKIVTDNRGSILINKKYWERTSTSGEVLEAHPWCFGDFNMVYAIFKELMDAINSGVHFSCVYDTGHLVVWYKPEERRFFIRRAFFCHEEMVLDE